MEYGDFMYGLILGSACADDAKNNTKESNTKPDHNDDGPIIKFTIGEFLKITIRTAIAGSIFFLLINLMMDLMNYSS